LKCTRRFEEFLAPESYVVGLASLAPYDERAKKRMATSTPKFLRLLPLIAQRPVMARWNRDAESIYEAEETKRNHARPLKANLYLIRLNNKCFDFKPI